MKNNDPSSTVILDLSADAIRVQAGERLLSVAMVQRPDGQWTVESRREAENKLRDFLGGSGVSHQRTAWCAISGRGVSIRRLHLPPAKAGRIGPLLQLQLEREFPIGPDQLAWGYRMLDSTDANGGREAMVVVTRRDLLSQYASLLEPLGLRPAFTLGLLAIDGLVPPGEKNHVLLHVGEQQSELAVFDNGEPAGLRCLPTGRRSILEALGESGGLGDAERILKALESGSASIEGREISGNGNEAISSHAHQCAEAVRKAMVSGNVFLTGRLAANPVWVKELAGALGGSYSCRPIQSEKQSVESWPILGLERCLQLDVPKQLIEIRHNPDQEEDPALRGKGLPIRWVAAMVLLLLGLFGLRYVEPLVKAPALAATLEDVKARRAALPEIEQELEFLRYLDRIRPEYLDALTVLADATPRGTQLESVSLNRNGDFTFRATMQSGQQATELRQQLVDSGLFYQVVLEDQSPDPQRRKFAIRFSAKWNTLAEKKPEILTKLDNQAQSAGTNQPGELP